MSFEQKRNAERLPLETPLDATASGLAAKIMEISAIGCRIDHKEKLSIGGSVLLRFKWRNENIEIRAKLARTQLKSAYPQGMYYESGLKFADSLEEAPEAIRRVVATLADPLFPPEIETPASAPASESEVGDRGSESVGENEVVAEKESLTTEEPEVAAEQEVEEEEEEVEQETPASDLQPPTSDLQPPTSDIQPPTSDVQPPASDVPPPTSDVPPPTSEEPIPDEELEEFDYTVPDEFEDIDSDTLKRRPKYVECALDPTGQWHRRPIILPIQPAEGFITYPQSESELDMLCRTYAYADPDTRRLIRISLELEATRKD